MQSDKRIILAVRVGIFLVGIFIALFLEKYQPEFSQRVDATFKDWIIRLVADRKVDTRILIVDIDDESLRQIGPWPWPRSRLADLVEITLMDHHARIVAIDIVLSNPADQLGDARLVALAENRQLVLSQIIDFSPRFPPQKIGVLINGFDASVSGKTSLSKANSYIGNAALFQHAQCVGNIGYIPDIDGVIRHLPLVSEFDNKNYLHLAPTILSCLGESVTAYLHSNAAAWWPVPYRRSVDSFEAIPAYRLLDGSISANAFSNRIVLIGSSSLVLNDRVSTPITPLISGVLIHAEALSSLLDLQEKKSAWPYDGSFIATLWILLTSLVGYFTIIRYSATFAAFLLLGLLFGWIGLCIWGNLELIELPLSAPISPTLFMFFAGIPFEWLITQRKASQAVHTLSHYVSEQVLAEIIRQDMRYSLNPCLRTVTVLIADIEGYTGLTAMLSLNEAASLTKDILECITQPLLSHGGTLDKYSGDGLVSFWGAPLSCPDQADIAIDCALNMLKNVNHLNQTHPLRDKGLPQVRVRIGVETGEALVGDLGTHFRSTYTAVGDCINFASRLESEARNHPFALMIGPETQRRLTRHTTVMLGTLAVRGTDKTIEIFTVNSTL